MERAVEDHAGDVAPVLERHVFDVLFLAQRGVVDEIVDAAEFLERRLRHRVDRGGIGDVGNCDERAAARRFDLLHHLVRFGAVLAHVDHDRAARGRELERDGAADAAPGAGDDRDAVLQFLFGHALSPQRGQIDPPFIQLSDQLAAPISRAHRPSRRGGH